MEHYDSFVSSTGQTLSNLLHSVADKSMRLVIRNVEQQHPEDAPISHEDNARQSAAVSSGETTKLKESHTDAHTPQTDNTKPSTTSANNSTPIFL